METFDPSALFTNDSIANEHRKIMNSEDVGIHFNNICATVNYLIIKKTGDQEAKLTDDQRYLITKLSDWLCGKFKPQSGILILGSKGCGKTTIMQGFLKYYCYIYKKIINEYHAKTLPMVYKAKGIDYFYKRPLFIDDLGKESESTVDWGQKYDTWGDLFAIRYELKSLTFATANYKLDGQFKDIYGEVIADRMKEHFNIFELVGESLRK